MIGCFSSWRRVKDLLNGLHWSLVGIFVLNAIVESFPLTAFESWLQHEIHVSPSSQSTFYATIFIPWSLKPLYAWISESFPIHGRRRKPYIMISGFLSATTYILVAFVVQTQTEALAVTLARTAANACTEIMADLMMLDYIGKNNANVGHIQSAISAVRSVASVLVLILTIPMYPCTDDMRAKLSAQTVLAATSVFPLAIILCAVFLPEPFYQSNHHSRSSAFLEEQSHNTRSFNVQDNTEVNTDDKFQSNALTTHMCDGSCDGNCSPVVGNTTGHCDSKSLSDKSLNSTGGFVEIETLCNFEKNGFIRNVDLDSKIGVTSVCSESEPLLRQTHRSYRSQCESTACLPNNGRASSTSDELDEASHLVHANTTVSSGRQLLQSREFPLFQLIIPAVLLLLTWGALRNLMHRKVWLYMLAGVLAVDISIVAAIALHVIRKPSTRVFRGISHVWPALVLFLLYATPTSSTQITSWYYNIWAQRPCYTQIINFVASLSRLIGSVFFFYFFGRFSGKRLLVLLILSLIIGNVLQLLYVPLVEDYISTSDIVRLIYACFCTLITSIAGQITIISILTVATRASPDPSHHQGGLVYAIALSFLDFGDSVSGWITTPIADALHITLSSYHGLPWLIYIDVITSVVVAPCTMLLTLSKPLNKPIETPSTSDPSFAQ